MSAWSDAVVFVEGKTRVGVKPASEAFEDLGYFHGVDHAEDNGGHEVSFRVSCLVVRDTRGPTGQ
jgi:hypothetical protein